MILLIVCVSFQLLRRDESIDIGEVTRMCTFRITAQVWRERAVDTAGSLQTLC